MKPNFALNLTHENIGLLHRTARGWLEVGAAALDDPDMGEALTYLRRSALGLAPHGVATKLVIPNSQLLYFETEAPGPDNAYRRAQIRRALEGRTPYAVEDLVFDWSGDGPVVQVVACARETLTEAEQFAAQYKFNPVSFVAIPEAGQFEGEPWLGATSIAAQILPAGETVERDDEPVQVVNREPLRPEPVVVPQVEPVVGPVVAPQVEDAHAHSAAAIPEAQPMPRASPEAIRPFEPVVPPEVNADVAPDFVAPEPAPAKDDDAIAPATPTAQMSFADVLNEQISASDLPPEPVAEGAPATGVKITSAAFSSRRAADLNETDLPPPLAPAVMGLRATSNRAPRITPQAPPVQVQAPTRDVAIDQPVEIAPAAAIDVAAPKEAFDPKTVVAKLGVSAPPKLAVPKAAAVKSAGPSATTAKIKAKAKALQAMVTAPGIAGIAARRAKTLVAPPPPPAPTMAANTIAPRSKIQQGAGTPKYLGLILTAILLVFLLLVAIWSSYSVAAWLRDDTSETVAQLPTPAVPQEEAPVAAPDSVDLTPEAVIASTAPETTLSDVVAASPSVSVPAQDEIKLSGVDAPPSALDVADVPQVAAGADALPGAQLPPPPFGTQYEYDANGLIKPTAEGVITPDGLRIVAGRPPREPGPRPEAIAALGLAPVAVVDPAPAAVPNDGVTAVGADPALATFRPRARPASIAALPSAVPAETASTAGLATDLTVAETAPSDGVTAVGADPALSGFRPRSRPAGLAPPPADQTTLPSPADPRLASARPLARPASVAALGEAARAATAAASLSASTDPAVEPQAEVIAAISPTAVAISRKPLARPRSFARAVEAAVAAAVRAPEPAPEPEPQQVAAAKPAPVVKAAKPKPTAPEADDEPEITGKAPSSPSKGVVAKQATFANAINLSKTNLIGVYGSSSKRYALVRTPQGRYKKVKVGDRFEGGTVAAITDSELRYQKGGRMIALSMPKG